MPWQVLGFRRTGPEIVMECEGGQKLLRMGKTTITETIPHFEYVLLFLSLITIFLKNSITGGERNNKINLKSRESSFRARRS